MKLQPIFINGRFLAQSVTGVQRYAREVVLALDGLLASGEIDSEKYAFSILAPPGTDNMPGLNHINFCNVGSLQGQAWEQFILPYISRNGWLFSFCNIGPLLKRHHIVTIHDASVFVYPDAYSFGFRTWYQFALPTLGKTAAKIITDSVFSENELIKYCSLSPDKISVVPLGVDHMRRLQPDYSVFQKHYLGDRPYILAVSSLSPHKNFMRLSQAFDLIQNNNIDIVVAGGVNSKVFRNSGFHTSQKNIHYIGYVSDNQLRALYERAHCFVYPSLYEGFGLPPLEAMSCGCPVIVSNAASLKEVCGDVVLYCDPLSYTDMADKINLLLNNDDLRQKMSASGQKWSAKYQWVDTARVIWKETLRMINK